MVTGGDVVTGHDPSTGKELWRLEGLNPENNPYNRIVASPVVAGDLVYVPSRVKPMVAVRAGGRGNVTATHRVWSSTTAPTAYAVSDGSRVVVNVKASLVLDARTDVGWGRSAPPGPTGLPVLAAGGLSNQRGGRQRFHAGAKFALWPERPREYTLSSPVAAADFRARPATVSDRRETIPGVRCGASVPPAGNAARPSRHNLLQRLRAEGGRCGNCSARLGTHRRDTELAYRSPSAPIARLLEVASPPWPRIGASTPLKRPERVPARQEPSRRGTVVMVWEKGRRRTRWVEPANSAMARAGPFFQGWPAIR